MVWSEEIDFQAAYRARPGLSFARQANSRIAELWPASATMG